MPRTAKSEFLWIEQGEPVQGLAATVAVQGPIDRTYSFTVPEELRARVEPGQRVLVPLGRKNTPTVGFCVDLAEGAWDSTLKPIASVLDPQSFLSPKMLELGRWISHYYCCPLGRTLSAMVPEAVRRQSGFTSVRYARLARPLPDILEAKPRLGGKQRALLEGLVGIAADVPVEVLLADLGISAATLRTVERRGWVEITTRREARQKRRADATIAEPEFSLNDEQAAAIERVETMLAAQQFGVALLFGVSGSGKTEVYVHAIRRAIADGGAAILLVPEIALTTQLVNRLAARFRDVAVIHSGLTGAQRSLTWADIAAARRSVIIGTRSAVFAPCPKLRLIVVDEEQESSYKNLSAPRFGVRDVAIKRAQIEGLPIVLGSATPSLETWVNCQRAVHFQRIDLKRRVRDLPMPRVHMVDTRDLPLTPAGPPILSPLLERKLGETLSRGEQAVLLLNRRGYARAIWCPACKRPLRCPHCQVAMVYHLSGGAGALCHYCHERFAPPAVCPDPSCATKLVAIGAGTQRAEELLQAKFPKARVVRVDSDTMLHARDYQKAVDDFEARRTDIMVGTQMIAKGLDFPFVSLVGVLGAEGGSADFRSQERLFQLIAQVGGRAGRQDLPGEVVVQTSMPDSPALAAAMRHDFATFADGELAIRRFIRYPPYTRLARIVLSDRRPAQLEAEAKLLAERFRQTIAAMGADGADVLGPTPCVLERLRDQYRWEVLLRAEAAPTLVAVLDRMRGEKGLRAKVKSLIVDVDPVSLS